MAQISDTLVLNFQVSGITALLAAMRQLESATDNLAEAQLRVATTAFGVFNQVIGLVRRAVDTYVDFGKEVRNVHELTGASFRESAQMVSLFRTAGIQDLQQIREFAHISQAMFTAEGRAGFGFFGLAPSAHVSDAQLLLDLLKQADKVQAGPLRTLNLERIVGGRGLPVMLQLLQLTEAQRKAALELGEAYNTKMLPLTQEWAGATSLLGQTIEMKLIFPLVEKLLPVLIKIVEGVTLIIDKFAELDKSFDGLLSTIVGFSAIAYGIGVVVKALKELAIWEAIVDALSGQWQNIALATAVGFGVWGISKFLEPGAEANKATGSGPVDKFGKAVDKFDAAVAEMDPNSWQNLNRGGIPSGLDIYGMDQLAKAMALGAIG